MIGVLLQIGAGLDSVLQGGMNCRIGAGNVIGSGCILRQKGRGVCRRCAERAIYSASRDVGAPGVAGKKESEGGRGPCSLTMG